MFKEQYLSNQSELGLANLPYMRAFSYAKFCVTIPSIRWVAGKTSPDWENTVNTVPALQGALHREILHVTQNPCDIMSVNMVGAIFPKDISICSGSRDSPPNRPFYPWTWPTCRLFSVALKSPLLSNQDEFCHNIWRAWKPYSQAFICCTIHVHCRGGCWER